MPSINISFACECEEKLINFRIFLNEQWFKSRQTTEKHSLTGHTLKKFLVDDVGWLSAQNICICRLSKKLDYKLYGILECIGKQPYQLPLLDVLKTIHDKFHVLLLEWDWTVNKSESDLSSFIIVDSKD